MTTRNNNSSRIEGLEFVDHLKQLEYSLDSKEVLNVMRLIVSEKIIDKNNEMYQTRYKHMPSKIYNYYSAIRNEVYEILSEENRENARYNYDRLFDHIFWKRDNNNILTIDSHPYLTLDGKDLKVLSELENRVNGLKVQILPASYYYLGWTSGIRFIMDINTAKIIKTYKYDYLRDYIFKK